MDDKQWSDYICRVPGTFWGETGRQHDETYRVSNQRAGAPIVPARSGGAGDLPQYSVTFGVLGFLGGTWYMYSGPDGDLGGALAIGALIGGIAATFYKPILYIGILGLMVWLFG